MLNGVGNDVLYGAYYIQATFSLPNGPNFTQQGTAFFVKNLNSKICLVTNRHILDAEFAEGAKKYPGAILKGVCIRGFLAPEGNTMALPTEHCESVLLLPLCKLRLAKNVKEDVACYVDPKVLFLGTGKSNIDFLIKCEDLADDDWINANLSISDLVAFPGFPAGHDKLAHRPILRMGSISSDPRANYSPTEEDQGRRIAYEAFSFNGSSGSPVIAIQKGFSMPPPFEVTGFREAKMIGINAGHFALNFGEHSGISYFLRSSVILELINET